MKKILVPIALTLIAAAAVAQPAGTSKAGESRSDLRVEMYRFNNFFQATARGAEQDINAYGAEYRYAYRFRPDDEVFVHGMFRKWSENGISNTFGGRVGWNHPGEVQAFRLYADQRQNLPSFDVGNTYGQADTTTVGGDYSYRIRKIWQVGVEGDYQRQTFANHSRNNSGTDFGASLRYRGFGWHFTPGIGVTRGHRSVNLSQEDYDMTGQWIQAEVVPTQKLYFSARYYWRNRDYTTDLRTSSNFNRSEERPQFTFATAIKTNTRLTWLIYYSREHVDSSRRNGDFTDSMLLISPQWRF